MDEIEQLKKQNADLLRDLQQVRNATLEEVALICGCWTNRDLSYEELASAIRAMKTSVPAPTYGGELTEVWAAKDMTVRHISTGALYIVLELAQAKINEQWREVVIYKTASDAHIFVQEVDRFCANFALVEGDTSNAIRATGLPADWQLILDEVGRATCKFPTWPTDPLHAVAVLGEEFGELTKAVLQTTYEPHKVKEGELRTEAIQTAAMAMRFLASLGRYEFAQSAQHQQLPKDTTLAKSAGEQA